MIKGIYNIAIVGQTGVGKSSLINYLFGKNVCKTGVGRPVTANGFHKIEDEINGMPVHLYDSWGLEVGKEQQWKAELQAELKNRGVDQHPSEWFHTIFYCIAASSSRIQDADIQIIQQFVRDKYKVSIVLTKADTVSEEDEQEFKKIISDQVGANIDIIAVCSESKTTRSGAIEAFGRDLLIKNLIISLIDSLIDRFPVYIEKNANLLVENWEEECQKIFEKNYKIFKIFKGFSDINSEIEKENTLLQLKLEKQIKKMCDETFSLYGDIFNSIKLNIDFDKKITSESIFITGRRTLSNIHVSFFTKTADLLAYLTLVKMGGGIYIAKQKNEITKNINELVLSIKFELEKLKI